MCRVARESLFARIADLVVDDPKAPRDLSSSPQHLEKYGRDRQSAGATRRAQAAAHQRIAGLQKAWGDSDPPAWQRLHNSGFLKARPDESVWPTGKTTKSRKIF